MHSDLAVQWLSLISINSEQVKYAQWLNVLSHLTHIGGSSPFNKKESVMKEWPMCNQAITVSSFLFVWGQTKHSFNIGNILCIWLMFSTCCFLAIPVFSKKKTSVTGQQQLALWLLTDLLFSLFWGVYVTPFWRVLLFQNSAVIPKWHNVRFPSRFGLYSYFIRHIRTGPLHMVTSGQFTVSSHQFEMQRNQNGSKNLAHCSTQNTINSKHPSHQSTISTYHYLQLQKILPVMHSV